MDNSINFNSVCDFYVSTELHDENGNIKPKSELKEMFKDCEFRFCESGSIIILRNGTVDLLATMKIKTDFLDKLIEEFIDNEI